MVGNQGLQLTDFNDMWRFSVALHTSGMAPKGLEKPESILIAVQAGAEVGLAPMQSVQSIAVINNRPTLWGDALKGLVDASGLCVAFREYEDGKPFNDDFSAVCECQRKGQDVVRSVFSVADAKRAGLWDKAGPWKQYPRRMLKARARAFALRDAFPDVLKGLRVAEEERDIIDVTPSSAPDQSYATTPQSDEDDIGATIARAADALDAAEGSNSAPETQTEREPGDEPPDEPEPPQSPTQADRIAAALEVAGIDADAYDAICESLSVAGMDPNLMDGPTIAKLELAIQNAGKAKKKGAK